MKLSNDNYFKFGENNQITVSANVRNAELYKKVFEETNNQIIVGGSCPTVGISGFTLGGGISLISSWYGIAVHYLKEVGMVLPNSTIAIINDQTDPELMFLLRGSGQNVGVVTNFTFDYSQVGRHNWNYIVLIKFAPNKENLVFALKGVRKALEDEQHMFSGLHFHRGAILLFLFAPSHLFTIEQMLQTAEKYFPKNLVGLELLKT